MEKEVDIAYCAGLFDGEGCVTVLWPKRNTFCMEINMVHEPALERFVEILGGVVTKHSRQRPEQRQQYRVRFYGPEAVRVGWLFFPYLVEKRDQVNEMINFSRADSAPEKDRCKRAISELKRRSY